MLTSIRKIFQDIKPFIIRGEGKGACAKRPPWQGLGLMHEAETEISPAFCGIIPGLYFMKTA